MAEVCQVQLQLLRKSQENSLRPSKEKKSKAHDKKPATLLKIYYFTSIFQGISLGFKQFVVAVYKDWLNKYNTFKD